VIAAALVLALASVSAPAAEPPYRIAPRVWFTPSCEPYRAGLEPRFRAAVQRLQDCLNRAYVRPDIAARMVAALETSPGVRLRCEEPPRSTWCAAAGIGEIWLSPSRLILPGSFCHPDLEAMFIHEVAHVAHLDVGPGHNERGETGLPDEVCSLQNYCMRPARMWLQRARRTADVVEPSRVDCMRRYQELTPSTLKDPFWDEYRGRRDPCS
jgi:hypothetical protein